MNIIKRIFVIVILVINIIFLVKTENYAANETNTSNITNKLENSNTTNITKSNNANASSTALTSLGIRPHDFTGFKNAITSYDVTVPADVESVEVYATTQNPNAKLEGTGIKKLQIGKNTVQVTVIAEDGTRKIFTINITRESKNETINNTSKTDTNSMTKNDEGLKSLSIKDVKLSPEFQSNTYEYTVKYIGEATKLEFETQPSQDNYIVEITGNSDLEEGENIITILVSKSNGDNVATYQITVNKSLIDEEAIAREKAEEEAKKQKIIIVIAVAAIVLIIIIIVIIKHKRNKKHVEDYSEISLYKNGYNQEDDDIGDEEEIPKALKKQKEKAKEEDIKRKKSDGKGKRFR